MNAIENNGEENESFNNSSHDEQHEVMIGDHESCSSSSKKGNKTESFNTNKLSSLSTSIVGNITAPFSLRKQIELAVQLSIDGKFNCNEFLFIHSFRINKNRMNQIDD